jgi:opine dehydrogenase
MILNAGWIEYTSGNFLFYSEGVTNSIAQVIESIDQERLKIMRKLQLRPETLKEILIRCGFVSSIPNSIYDAICSSETIRLIKSPESLAHRYLIEDVGYGLVPMTNFAKCVGITTTITDSLINLACILNKLDHWNKGLTIQKLGINNMEIQQLKGYVKCGI